MEQSKSCGLEDFVLYKSPLCGFCFRVTHFLKRQGIEIQMRDVMTDSGAAEELRAGGGRTTVPCLRIKQEDGSTHWMYESMDIINFLSKWCNQQP